MDNEKNSVPNNNHKRNKHARPKSYFIDPNGEKKDVQINNLNAPEEKNNVPYQNQNSTAPQKHPGDPHKPHHRHHHKPDKQDKTEKIKDAEISQSAPVQNTEPKPQGEAQTKKNNYNRNKNKPKNNVKDEVNVSPDIVVAKEEKKKVSPTAPEKTKGPQRKEKKVDTQLNAKPTKKEAPDFNENDYEQIRFPSVSTDTDNANKAESHPVKMIEVVGIRFKSTGKVYYFEPNGKKFRRGEYAIVETARGLEYGEVAMGNKQVRETDTVSPLRPVIRIATEADKKHHADNKRKEEEAFRVCNEKIIAHELDMKLIDAQYTFDNSKLLFYFTSAGRVDFRELVKDLASVFKTRIELRQIGIRDEAKLMGGVGMCGRPLCCTLFLSDFGQVSIKMAKEQNLSLNSAKISGICGRLMCCLRYEHETYEYEIKRTPPVDAFVHTEDGNGIVTEINPLVGTIKVRLTASPDAPPKSYKREDVIMLQKKQNKED